MYLFSRQRNLSPRECVLVPIDILMCRFFTRVRTKVRVRSRSESALTNDLCGSRCGPIRPRTITGVVCVCIGTCQQQRQHTPGSTKGCRAEKWLLFL